MATITAVWLPILLSAIGVFFASSIIHMVLKYHAHDIKRLPNEAAVEGLRGVPTGVYVFPFASSMKEVGTPAMVEKYTRGPIGIVTVLPTRAPTMGKSLVLWFVFALIVSIFIAYLGTRTLAAGVDYLGVFRLTGTVAFLTYAGAETSHSIWAGQPWSNTVRHYIDALIYAGVTAGIFAAMWPWRTP